jgi:hypothetical protein
MDTHSQAFARIAAQLERQNAAWQDVRRFIDNFDPRTLFAVDEALLADIETVCGEKFSTSEIIPLRGLRG